MTGIIDQLNTPPPQKVAVRSMSGMPLGYMDFRESKPWFDWFNSLTSAGRQVTVSGTLDFGNTPAQTSNGLLIIFTIGGVTIALDSFVLLHEPVVVPANCLFTSKMWAENQIAVVFHNYSAAAINPGPLEFDILVIPKLT